MKIAKKLIKINPILVKLDVNHEVNQTHKYIDLGRIN